MKGYSKILDRVSGFLFFVGFSTSRLKYIPNFMFAAVLNIVSLASYAVGYSIWYISGFFQPEQQRERESWYGFAQFKDQYQAAALLGLLATLYCVISPALLVPAAWIYTTANVMWTIGEYHKNARPSFQDEQHSSVRQAHYFRYSLLSSISSGIATVATTVAFIFPSTAFIALIASSAIVVCLMAVGIGYWLYCFFGTFPPDATPQTYITLNQMLDTPSLQSVNDMDLIDAPTASAPLFQPQDVAKNDENQEMPCSESPDALSF